MNDAQHLATELKKIMQARWSVKRPAANLETSVQQKLAARRARKRILQIGSAVGLTVAASLTIFLIFTTPNIDALQMLRGMISPPNPPAPNAPSTLFTAFECPTPIPPPLTRYPQATAAPQPTFGPSATSGPTHVKKTRLPRPTGQPTPTIVFLTEDGEWKTYQDPEYDFTFEYPTAWSVQTSFERRNLPDPRAWQPGSFVSIWNYAPERAPARNPQEALTIQVNLSPAFCEYETLERAVNHSAMTEVSPLIPRGLVGGYPAWQHTIRPPYQNPNEWLEVVVPRGKWLYRFQADPVDSHHLAVFEHLLTSFSSP